LQPSRYCSSRDATTHRPARGGSSARRGLPILRVMTYRPPLHWIAYPMAALLVLIGLGGIGIVEKDAHGGVTVVIGLLAIVLCGFVAPVALVRLVRGMGVRVSDAGVVSIGNRYADVFGWADIDHFVVRENRADGSVAVYLVLRDGSEVPLWPLRGRLWTRSRLRRIGAELQTRLLDERANAQTRSGTPAQFAAIPRGWRRRDHGPRDGQATVPRLNAQ